MQRIVTAALAAATLLLATAVHAVYVSTSGLGQALIYPYYTVRAADGNAFNTYLSTAPSPTKASRSMACR